MIQANTIALLATTAMLTAVSCNKDDARATASTEPSVDEAAVAASAAEQPTPTAAAQIDQMTADCDASARARAARHAKEPLYGRLGGHDGIANVTKKIIARHVAADSPIKDLFTDVDLDVLAEHVVDFIGAGTGGQEKYTGRSMKDGHAHLKLTPEMFLAAGVDIMESLEEVKAPKNESEELMCIVLSFKDDVVTM